jgi:hypothetical protein
LFCIRYQYYVVPVVVISFSVVVVIKPDGVVVVVVVVLEILGTAKRKGNIKENGDKTKVQIIFK